MIMNLKFQTIGLSLKSVLVTSTSLNRLTSFTILYRSEPHYSGGVTKSPHPYNKRFFPISYPLNPMRHE